MDTQFDYSTYITSKRWESRRRIYFSSHSKICWACKSKDSIHLHHLTYERAGSELDSDLLPLCERCHTLVHQYHNIRKLSRDVSLKDSTFAACKIISSGRSVMGEKPVSPRPTPPKTKIGKVYSSKSSPQKDNPDRTKVKTTKPDKNVINTSYDKKYPHSKQFRNGSGLPIVMIKK